MKKQTPAPLQSARDPRFAAPPPTPTDADLERRYAAALQLRREGYTQMYIATRLNVSQSAVCRWCQGVQGVTRPRGPQKLAKLPQTGPKPRAGRPPFITDEGLRALFAERPEETWTGADFLEAIRARFGLRYSISYGCALVNYLREGLDSRSHASRADRHAPPLTLGAGA